MRTSKLPTREDAVAEYVAQIEPGGPLFVAGCGNGKFMDALAEAVCGPVSGCDIESELPRYQGDFCEWWRRAGGEGTFAAVVALGWPAKMDPRDPSMFGLVASCKWLLKPGGYFLMDWPKKMGVPIILDSALRHVGFNQVDGFCTATHPVYIWQIG